MLLKNQNIIKIPIVVVAVVTLLFGSFCFGMSHKSSTEMVMTETSITNITVMNSQPVCCGEAMSQHVKSLANTFLAIPHDLRNNLVLFALTLFLTFVLMRSLFSSMTTDLQLLSGQLYLRQKSKLFVFNPLELAFARGILNTKVY